jgi:hypothetical protein
MKFRLKTSLPVLLALTCAGLSHPVNAADSNAYLYIAHAASGRNISSTTNPAYPVDVSVAGICVAKGASFGDIQGPFTGTAGTYVVKVSVANVASPCGNPAVFTGTAALQAGKAYLTVLTLDASNHVLGQLFAVNVSAVPSGKGRTAVFNATLSELGAVLKDENGSTVGSANVAPGAVLVSDNVAGMYAATIYVTGARTAATGPVPVTLSSKNLYLYVLAGAASNDSIQLIGPKVIGDVF